MDNDDREKFNSELREYVSEARKNRHDFLKPYKEKFESSESQKERAQIVIELIKLVPSHLDERWVASEVARWLRNHDDLDYLNEAFIRQGGRSRPGPKSKLKETCDRLLVKVIDKRYEQNKNNVSRVKLFEQLAIKQTENPSSVYPTWNENNTDHQLSLVIKHMYYKCRRNQKKKIKEGLPFPYYGLDLTLEKGNFELFFRK